MPKADLLLHLAKTSLNDRLVRPVRYHPPRKANLVWVRAKVPAALLEQYARHAVDVAKGQHHAGTLRVGRGHPPRHAVQAPPEQLDVLLVEPAVAEVERLLARVPPLEDVPLLVRAEDLRQLVEAVVREERRAVLQRVLTITQCRCERSGCKNASIDSFSMRPIDACVAMQ